MFSAKYSIVESEVVLFKIIFSIWASFSDFLAK